MKHRLMLSWAYVAAFSAVQCWAGSARGVSFKVDVAGYADGIQTRGVSEITWCDGAWVESDEGGSAVFDLKNGVIRIVDHANRIWTGGPSTEFLREMESAVTKTAGLVTSTYRLSPKAGTRPGERPAVRSELLSQELVGERPCRHYRIWAGKEVVHEAWVDPALAPGRFFDLEKTGPVLDRFTEITAIFSREFDSREDFQLEQAIRLELRKLFPVGLEIRSREYRSGRLRYEKNVTGIRAVDPPLKGVEAPEGYRKVTYQEYMDANVPADPDFDDPDDAEKPVK